MKGFLQSLSFFGAVFWGLAAYAETPADFSATFEILAPENVRAGEIADFTLSVKLKAGSYTYANTPGEMGLPTKIDWQLPSGFKLIKEAWDEAQNVGEEGINFKAYKKDFSVRAKVMAPQKLAEDTLQASAKIFYLLCTDDSCTPKNEPVSFSIHTTQSESAQTHGGVLYLLGLAFLGGLILNLMPCVFPVISLKILSFVKDAGGKRSKALAGALLYSLGIVLSFLVLAALLVWLKSAGGELGWGFQLQNSIFVFALAFLFLGISLSMLGIFAVGANLMNAGGKFGKSSSFFSGVLAVLVASPCSAPFMATALGFALAGDTDLQNIFFIFISLGLGMASPYVLLSAIPSLSKFMPKPGKWMGIFQKILSIPLFLTAAWLVWVFYMQRGHTAAVLLCLGLFLFALALFIWGKWGGILNAGKTRILASVLGVLLILSSIFIALKASSLETGKMPIENAWSEEKVAELRAEGKMVYVDFTASWCWICSANKIAVLNKNSTKEIFKNGNVAFLCADWTNNDAAITRKLGEFGRSSVPLNLLYPADAKKAPAILPQILTQKALIEAIDKARQ